MYPIIKATASRAINWITQVIFSITQVKYLAIWDFILRISIRYVYFIMKTAIGLLTCNRKVNRSLMTVITNNVRRYSGINRVASGFILLILREPGQHTRSKKMKSKNWEPSRFYGTRSWLHDVFNKARNGVQLSYSENLCLCVECLFHSFVFVQWSCKNALILSTRGLHFLKNCLRNVFALKKSQILQHSCSYFFSTLN